MTPTERKFPAPRCSLPNGSRESSDSHLPSPKNAPPLSVYGTTIHPATEAKHLGVILIPPSQGLWVNNLQDGPGDSGLLVVTTCAVTSHSEPVETTGCAEMTVTPKLGRGSHGAFALLPLGSLALKEPGCHAVRTLEQPCGEATCEELRPPANSWH